MTGRLYLDIETANVPEAIRAIARPFMKYHGSLKDPEKIVQAQEANLDKTALDGLWGEVVAIGFAPDDENAECIRRGGDVDENYLLNAFSQNIGILLMNRWHKSSPCIIGHNVTWDIRFLYQRYIVNGLKPPHWLLRALKTRPWDADKVFDAQVQWAGVHGYVKLGALCAGLGIEVPETIDGADVPQAWLDGRYDEIRAHVLADVEAVRQVHKRMVVTL